MNFMQKIVSDLGANSVATVIEGGKVRTIPRHTHHSVAAANVLLACAVDNLHFGRPTRAASLWH